MNEELLKDREASKKSKKSTKKKNTFTDVKFGDLEGKLLLVKVGAKDGKPSESDLDYMQKKLTKEIEKKGVNCIVIVAGHNVTMEIIEKQK